MHFPVMAKNAECLKLKFKKSGPFYDGARAYYAQGVSRKDNPYQDGTPESLAWIDGWDEEAFYGGWEQTEGLFDLDESANQEREGI